jgi:hypothetical protein
LQKSALAHSNFNLGENTENSIHSTFLKSYFGFIGTNTVHTVVKIALENIALIKGQSHQKLAFILRSAKLNL